MSKKGGLAVCLPKDGMGWEGIIIKFGLPSKFHEFQ